MADLSTLFNNLGPAGASILAGVQMGNEANRQQDEQRMNDARLAQILQETKQNELMNPLNVQAKQQAIAAGELEAKQKRDAYRDEVLSKAIPELERTPAAARHARAQELFAQAGMPLDQADLAHMNSLNPDALLKEMKSKHEFSVTQSADYRKAMDVAREHSRSAEAVARIGADSREAIAKSKQKATDIVSQVQSGKLSAEKAAVAFDTMATVENDPAQKLIYQQQAAKYEQLAAKLRAAGGIGKVDVGAATGMPTTGYEPVLAPSATPPATPNSPQLPTGWTIK